MRYIYGYLLYSLVDIGTYNIYSLHTQYYISSVFAGRTSQKAIKFNDQIYLYSILYVEIDSGISDDNANTLECYIFIELLCSKFFFFSTKVCVVKFDIIISCYMWQTSVVAPVVVDNYVLNIGGYPVTIRIEAHNNYRPRTLLQ